MFGTDAPLHHQHQHQQHTAQHPLQPPSSSRDDDEQLVLSLLEFLEVAVHTSLWSRALYPPDLFQRVRYCGLNARRSRHPGLNSYIGNAISKLKVPLKARALQEVAIVFFDATGAPLERITFIVKLSAPEQALGRDARPDIAAIEAGFTSALLVLSCTDSLCKPLPQGSTFELLAYSTSRQGMDMSFFCEESAGCTELRQPISAHALKSIVVEGSLKVQVLLELGCKAAAA